MTESQQNEQTDIHFRYQSRKSKCKTPRSVRAHVLAVARKKQFKFEPGHYFSWNWLLGIACTAATLLLVNLTVIQYSQLNAGFGVDKNYTHIQLHKMNGEAISSMPISMELSDIRTHNYAGYIEQKQAFNLHHQEMAKLIESERGWSLETCNEGLVQISHELMTELYNLERISPQILKGDNVNISFDKFGRILHIRQVPMAC